MERRFGFMTFILPTGLIRSNRPEGAVRVTQGVPLCACRSIEHRRVELTYSRFAHTPPECPAVQWLPHAVQVNLGRLSNGAGA